MGSLARTYTEEKTRGRIYTPAPLVARILDAAGFTGPRIASATVLDPDKKYANTKMTNKEMFSNLKAQSWWHVADMFRNTYNAVTKGYTYDVNDMISIDSAIGKKIIDQLVEELSTPRKDIDNSGRTKVESKKDLGKREVDSPNVADSFIIANSGRMMRRRSLGEWL